MNFNERDRKESGGEEGARGSETGGLEDTGRRSRGPMGGAGRPRLQGTPLRVEAGAGTEECSSPPMTVLISERLG